MTARVILGVNSHWFCKMAYPSKIHVCKTTFSCNELLLLNLLPKPTLEMRIVPHGKNLIDLLKVMVCTRGQSEVILLAGINNFSESTYYDNYTVMTRS